MNKMTKSLVMASSILLLAANVYAAPSPYGDFSHYSNTAAINTIIVEITVLTKPELIKVKQPQDYPAHIDIGRDGLIVELNFYKGLLLPQVPIEQAWNKEDYLSHTCMKAGLPRDAWKSGAKIEIFSALVFGEGQ